MQSVCRLVFQNGFQVFLAAAMNPEHVAESGRRIAHPEFPDCRELFRNSDIKSTVAFLIFRFPFQFVVAFSLADLSGRCLVFALTLITQLFDSSWHRGKANTYSFDGISHCVVLVNNQLSGFTFECRTKISSFH